MNSALREAVKQAARDERDRLGCQASDYAIGCIVEAVITVITHAPPEPPPRPPHIDVDSWEGEW